MQSLNINVTEVKLGNFDLGSTFSRSTDTSANARDLEAQFQSQSQAHGFSSAVTHWHSSQRAAVVRSSLGQTSMVRGSAVREFHNAVFDALAPPQRFTAFGVFPWGTSRKPGLVYAGSGARLYDVVSTIVPQGLIGWMMDNTHKQRWALTKSFEPTNKAATKASSPSGSNGWGAGSATVSESGIWERL